MSRAQATRGGFQPYIASRLVRGDRVPQAVQGLVIRDYAARNTLDATRLPAAEYSMPGCYMMLESILADLASIDGIICYSLFMLPMKAVRRRAIYARVLAAGCSLHGALEGLAVRAEADIDRVEDVIRLVQLTSQPSALSQLGAA